MFAGSVGTVVKILYRPGDAPPKLPELVYVRFPEYLGESVIGDPKNDKVVAIAPITSHWIHKKQPCSRRMLPLKNGSSVTIHKSQGKLLSLSHLD